MAPSFDVIVHLALTFQVYFNMKAIQLYFLKIGLSYGNIAP